MLYQFFFIAQYSVLNEIILKGYGSKCIDNFMNKVIFIMLRNVGVFFNEFNVLSKYEYE